MARRFTISQVLTAVLIAALTLAHFVNRMRSQRQIALYKTRADVRERLEDDLELALVDQLAPGDRLDADPYYRLLVDRIVTDVDPDFTGLSEFFAKNVEDAPKSFDGCEFHEFTILTQRGSTECQYIVIVRDNRCVFVILASTHVGPYPSG